MSDCYCTTNNTVHATYCPEYKYAWRDKRIEELEKANERKDRSIIEAGQKFIKLKEQLSAETARADAAEEDVRKLNQLVADLHDRFL